MSNQQRHDQTTSGPHPAADKGDSDLLVLVTGLFPDAATLEAALQEGGDVAVACRREIDPEAMNEADWDRLLADILAARTIVTL